MFNAQIIIVLGWLLITIPLYFVIGWLAIPVSIGALFLLYAIASGGY